MSAGRAATLNPENRALAKAASDMADHVAYQAAYDNAVKLRDAGVITGTQFADFASILSQQFAPAVRNAAWAVAEAARTMNDNLSTLNQQWSVFGTSAQGQVADLATLYGFGGQSASDVQGKFTKVTPGKAARAAEMPPRKSNRARASGSFQSCPRHFRKSRWSTRR